MSAPASSLWCGLGRADITACVPGLSMFGWGSPGNIPTAAATALTARALAISEGLAAPPQVLVVAELGMISEALRSAVLEMLSRRGRALAPHQLALTATHTHSGPSGFSSYMFYAMAGPGFSAALVERLARRIADAIELALQRLAPARVWLHAEDLPRTAPVSFQRALAAYNRNADVAPVRADRIDDAVDRRMTVLRIESEGGRPIGLLSFFPVHGTAIHADHSVLHHDVQGVAARACELRAASAGHRDFVALFAQESAGDVTPNYRFDPRRGFMVGRFDDDFESAEWNGGEQARHAFRVFERARETGVELGPPVISSLRYVDLGRIARLGLASAKGTAEGPGPLRAFPRLAKILERSFRWSAGAHTDAGQEPKTVLIDLGPGTANRIAHRFDARHPLVGLATDRRLRYFNSALAHEGVRSKPWVPHRLPFQMLRIGGFAAALTPFEPTTVAGRRIRAAVRSELSRFGVIDVVSAGYANAYASYLTTPEEYDEQDYEGTMTLFGRETLVTACAELAVVARQLVSGRPPQGIGEAPLTVPLANWLPVGARSAAPAASWASFERARPRWELRLARPA